MYWFYYPQEYILIQLTKVKKVKGNTKLLM